MEQLVINDELSAAGAQEFATAMYVTKCAGMSAPGWRQVRSVTWMTIPTAGGSEARACGRGLPR